MNAEHKRCCVDGTNLGICAGKRKNRHVLYSVSSMGIATEQIRKRAIAACLKHQGTLRRINRELL